MRLEAIHKSAHNSEECPTCRGEVRRRPFGKMHAGSFIQNGERVEICREPNAGYVDPIVLDQITQYFDGGLYRLWPSENYYARGGIKLHRAVWSAAFGDIPKGCHIHHRDGNQANNAIDNLECLDGREHLSKEWQLRKSGLAEHFSENARARAAEWHRSDAGRLWHKRHAERSKGWNKWKREPRNCLFCGNEYSALIRKNGHVQKYCGNNCKAADYRRRRAA